MIIRVTESKFADIMTDHGFSYSGACALFQYLEEVGEADTELDPVALRCEFSEYETYLEYVEDCLGFCMDEYKDEYKYDWDEHEEMAEPEVFAKSYAEKHGDVVCEFDGGIIIRD